LVRRGFLRGLVAEDGMSALDVLLLPISRCRRRCRFGRRDVTVGLVERSHARRHDLDDLALVGDDRALGDHGRPECRLERERRPRDQREPDADPVFAGQILHDAPRLQVGLAVRRNDDAVRRAPHRRFREIADG
jgi:hypothetical protein